MSLSTVNLYARVLKLLSTRKESMPVATPGTVRTPGKAMSDHRVRAPMPDRGQEGGGGDDHSVRHARKN
jgi:hypothetical protein